MGLETSLLNLTTLFQGPEWTTDKERGRGADESIKKLRSYLEQNRIFFAENLCEKIEIILSDSHKITVDMFMAKRTQVMNDNYSKRGYNLSEKVLLDPSNTWHKLNEKVEKEIKAARLSLAQEFRILIGVS